MTNINTTIAEEVKAMTMREKMVYLIIQQQKEEETRKPKMIELKNGLAPEYIPNDDDRRYKRVSCEYDDVLGDNVYYNKKTKTTYIYNFVFKEWVPYSDNVMKEIYKDKESSTKWIPYNKR